MARKPKPAKRRALVSRCRFCIRRCEAKSMTVLIATSFSSVVRYELRTTLATFINNKAATFGTLPHTICSSRLTDADGQLSLGSHSI